MLSSVGPGPLKSSLSEPPKLQLRSEPAKPPSATATNFPPSQSREQLLEEIRRGHEKGLQTPRQRSYVAKKPKEKEPEVAVPAITKPHEPDIIPEQRNDLKAGDILPTPAVNPPTAVPSVLPATPPTASVPQADAVSEQIAALFD